MNTEELRRLITELNAMLKRVGLDWVVQEVSSVIERGVEERKQVDIQSFDITGQPLKKRGPKSEATTTRPFGETEELDLLLAAVRAAVIHTFEIRKHAVEMLQPVRTTPQPQEASNVQIRFRRDVPSGFE